MLYLIPAHFTWFYHAMQLAALLHLHCEKKLAKKFMKWEKQLANVINNLETL